MGSLQTCFFNPGPLILSQSRIRKSSETHWFLLDLIPQLTYFTSVFAVHFAPDYKTFIRRKKI
jgi:hypothetical protein